MKRKEIPSLCCWFFPGIKLSCKTRQPTIPLDGIHCHWCVTVCFSVICLNNLPSSDFWPLVSCVTASPARSSITMVDIESHYQPPSPLEDSVLDGPLCGDDDFMGSMEALQDIPSSIDEDALSSLDVPEYQSSHNGSEGSSFLGNSNRKVLRTYLFARCSRSSIFLSSDLSTFFTPTRDVKKYKWDFPWL